MTHSVRVLGILATLALSACIPNSSPIDSTGDATVEANVDSAALTVGQAAQLSASVNAGSATFRWYQTYGREVTLSDAKAATTTFVAPSLRDAQTLRFRVDAKLADGRTNSASVEVQVAADPNFGVDTSTGGSSTDTDPFPQVRLKTSKGNIVIELDRDKAPASVANFLRYTDDGFYDGTIFHRVIKNFVVQGGGFEPGLKQKEVRAPIVNEASNGLKNVRSSVAMARTNDPNSATAQFYINLKDNTDLDFRQGFPGYAVFGRVIQGMDVVDTISNVETQNTGGFQDVPVQDVVLQTAERVAK
ncbi:MAG: peptidylprolyl isomerase [Phycisphaerae bacterium]